MTTCWFSCGAASAVATKLMLAEDPSADVVRIGIAEEHPDNERFAAECSAWFGKPVTVLTAQRYVPGAPKDARPAALFPSRISSAPHGAYASIFEVFRQRRYLVGPGNAKCTVVLKKEIRENSGYGHGINVFGYTAEEQERVNRFIDANPLVKIRTPLIERNLGKADCLAMVERAGIQLPAMYRLGYNNNNCIGCVKGGAGYWNKIRRDFPDAFERMAQQEEALKRTVLKLGGERITLRQLPPDAGRDDEPVAECSIFCHMAETALG